MIAYNRLYNWYEANRRELPWRETTDPYKIWLSEVILQQTRVAQGMEYYLRFIAAFPTVRDLAEADEDQVMRLWQGLGYYSRARNLHKAAKLLICKFANLPNCFPRMWEELRELPGVGDYTAGAIAAFAYNLPYPALDGNVYRVLSRLFDCEIAFDTSRGKKHFHALAEEILDRENPRLFDSAIMELGALHCVPQAPDCVHCPLAEDCQAYRSGTVALLPVRKERPKVTERRLKYVLYLTPNRHTLIHKRTGKDIWQGLWELVEIDAAMVPEHAIERREYKHLLSHRKLLANFYTVLCETLPSIPDTADVALSDLDQYGFSRLTLLYLEDNPIIHKPT